MLELSHGVTSVDKGNHVTPQVRITLILNQVQGQDNLRQDSVRELFSYGAPPGGAKK